MKRKTDSSKPIRLVIATAVLTGAATAAHAQFAYNAAQTVADAQVGIQNAASFGLAAEDRHTSNLVQSLELTGSEDYSAQDGGMTYHGTGYADIVTKLNAGGYRADFTTDGTSQVTAGANSFDGPRGDGDVSHEVHFTVGQSGFYALQASAQFNASTNPALGGASFVLQLWDEGTNTLLQNYNIALASMAFNNVNTTVDLTAGEKYYTNWYEITYSITPGANGPTAADHLNVTGSVLVGNPGAVPEPASMCVLALGLLAFLRRRR